MSRALVVTGATGYIGRALVRRARRDGWRVVAASRSRPADDVEWIPYALADALDERAIPQASAIVHLAADTRADAASEALEVAAIDRLLDTAEVRGATVVFVSSQTARRDAPTAYGRTKAAVEARVLARGGVAVRPGFVYGGEAAGVFGIVVRLVQRLPILPRLLPAPRVQPLHVDDLCRALLALAARPHGDGRVYRLGEPRPVPLDALLDAIAVHRLRTVRVFVPVPAALVRLSVRLLPRRFEGVRIRILSLLDLPAMETADDLAALGVALRPLAEGLAPRGDGRRRRLLAEGRAFVSYFLGGAAPAALVRRYVRVVERQRGRSALAIGAATARHPALVALLDASRDPAALEIDWRLDAALAIAEASPPGARRLLGVDDRGPLGAAARIGAAILRELVMRVLRPLTRAARRRASAGG